MKIRIRASLRDFIATGLAATGLLLASHAAAHASPSPDIPGYINALKRDGVEPVNGGNNAQLIQGGMYMCQEIRDGKNTYDVAQELLIASHDLDMDTAEAVVADAQTYLCPDAL